MEKKKYAAYGMLLAGTALLAVGVQPCYGHSVFKNLNDKQAQKSPFHTACTAFKPDSSYNDCGDSIRLQPHGLTGCPHIQIGHKDDPCYSG